MTPKVRVLTAMNLQKPDRIPFMCQLSIGHFLQKLNISPAEFWFEKNVFADALIEMRNIYDFDGILISLHGHYPDWKSKVKKIKKENTTEFIEWKNGDKTICVNNDLPQYIYSEKKNIFNLTDFDIESLPSTLNYIPVSQDLHFQINQNDKFSIYYDILKRAGDRYSIHGEITSPFDYYLDLTGHQDGLIGLMDAPDKVHKIINHYTQLIKNLSLEMCETGIDAIKISSPFAGAGFISPNDYKEFVLPYEREIALAIREKGIHVYTHTCGAINDRLEMMFEAGINGIECLDPEPIGDVDLSDAKKRNHQLGFIKGNLDSVNLLLFGSDEEIKKETINCLNIGKEFGGLILSTACSVAPAVKREKLLFVRELVEKYG